MPLKRWGLLCVGAGRTRQGLVGGALCGTGVIYLAFRTAYYLQEISQVMGLAYDRHTMPDTGGWNRWRMNPRQPGWRFTGTLSTSKLQLVCRSLTTQPPP